MEETTIESKDMSCGMQQLIQYSIGMYWEHSKKGHRLFAQIRNTRSQIQAMPVLFHSLSPGKLLLYTGTCVTELFLLGKDA